MRTTSLLLETVQKQDYKDEKEAKCLLLKMKMTEQEDIISDNFVETINIKIKKLQFNKWYKLSEPHLMMMLRDYGNTEQDKCLLDTSMYRNTVKIMLERDRYNIVVDGVGGSFMYDNDYMTQYKGLTALLRDGYIIENER